MKLVERVLGHPWVYEHVRSLPVGGIDLSRAYRLLECDERSVVLDVGCGMGDALRHIGKYADYLGLDTDGVALAHARARHAGRRNLRFEQRSCSAQDLSARPVSHVSLIGVLHHLSDREALGLLRALASCASLVRAVCVDTVYLEGRFYNNLLAWYDGGRYCRDPGGYPRLAREAGLQVHTQQIVRSHPTRGLVDYFVMELSR